MVGVGVGSGEWQELDSPREWDKPNLVILLIALDIFRPAPFMLATRANKNEQEQLDSSYVSEMKMKLLPECCSSKCVDNLAVRKSNGNPRAKFEREWVNDSWVGELNTHLSASIYRENGRAPLGGAGHNG